MSDKTTFLFSNRVCKGVSMETAKTTKKATCKRATKLASTAATTKKACGCKSTTTASSSSSTTSCNKTFPTEYLNSWLQNRYSWNHSDWLGLLSELSAKGYTYYSQTSEGQAEVGNYIEANRWR